jgi:hypothetical protein
VDKPNSVARLGAHQCRDEERHQRDAGTVYDFIRDDNFNGQERAVGPNCCRPDQQQYGASFGGPIAQNRTFFFLGTSSNGCSIKPAWSRFCRRTLRSLTPS